MISPRSFLFLGFVLVIGCSSEPDDPSSVAAVDTTESFIQPYEENPQYLAWGNTPIFPLGAAGYHSWTPISRPGTMDFEAQLDRLGAVMKAIDSPHVLINLSNESRAHVDWSHYWAEYARERLPDRMMIGEMPSTKRETDEGQCDPALSPEAIARDTLYDYVDVAQAVSGHSFQEFSEQALGGGRRINDYRAAMTASGTRKPVIVSKDYGRTPDGGEQVLWSRFFGGAAAARFHRLGREHGQEVIDFQHAAVERLGQFLAEIPFWRMQPAPELITELPSTVGANILADGQARASAQVIGETGGTLTLDLPGGNWTVEWIDPNTSQSIDSNGEARHPDLR